jgi:hypothetical protein
MVTTVYHRESSTNHVWTEDDKGLVRLHYDGTRENCETLAAMIGCSRQAVKSQVELLGLSFQVKQPEWTVQEKDYLRTHYTSQSVNIMAKTLHRSPNAVKIKVTRMHLSLRNRDGWYDKMDVCEMLGVDHHKVQAWIDRGDLKATYHHGTRPTKKGMTMWHIDAGDLKTFIVHHCQELQGRNLDIFSILDLCGVIPDGRAV